MLNIYRCLRPVARTTNRSFSNKPMSSAQVRVTHVRNVHCLHPHRRTVCCRCSPPPRCQWISAHVRSRTAPVHCHNHPRPTRTCRPIWSILSLACRMHKREWRMWPLDNGFILVQFPHGESGRQSAALFICAMVWCHRRQSTADTVCGARILQYHGESVTR